MDVVVDDKLPTQNGRLIYLHNNVDQNEMFGPLLEKAYAKLNYCYEYLIGGNACDALIDLTGGVNETYQLKKANGPEDSNYMEPNKLWEFIFESYAHKSLASASIEVKGGKKLEGVEDNGLVLGHAYGILQVYELLNKNGSFSALRQPKEPAGDKSIKLLKLRNPWGQVNPKTPWNGRWCQGAKDWSQVSDQIKQAIGANKQEDGEFFISLEDFMRLFDNMDIVRVDFNMGNNNSKWEIQQFDGAWVPGKNAGGKLFFTLN